MPPKTKAPARPPPPVESDPEIESEQGPAFEKETMLEMPVEHRRRVYAMRGMSQTYRSLRAAYLESISEAKREEQREAMELWNRRREIVNGAPLTDKEVARATAASEKRSTVEELPSDDDAVNAEKADPKEKRVSFQASEGGDEAPVGGIPNFWLTALQNAEATSNSVEGRDIDALRKLTDIQVSFVDNDPRKGFSLAFHFAPNEYFTNPVLTKTYLYDRSDENSALSFDDTLDSIKGCTVQWTSPAKKLTVVLKQRKQRHKSGKGTRVVTREEDVPSFFHFFTAPDENAHDGDDDDDDDEDPEERMYEDYSVGEAIAKAIVPRAAYYYTGKSIDDIAGTLDFTGMNDDDDDDEEEEEDVPQPIQRGRRGKVAGRGGAGIQPKCEQQ